MNNIQAERAPKLKKSTIPYQYIDQTVYVFRDRCDGKVVLSFSPEWTDCFIGERDNVKPVRKMGYSIVAKPKKLTIAEKENKLTLTGFYNEMALIMPFECQECKHPLYAYTTFAQRCCTCHILPKSLFPSIAKNPHNILFMGASLLGYCTDHDKWDSCVEARKSMNVYPLALEAFTKYLRYDLNDEDLISACDYMGVNWRDYVHA